MNRLGIPGDQVLVRKIVASSSNSGSSLTGMMEITDGGAVVFLKEDWCLRGVSGGYPEKNYTSGAGC